MTEVNPLMSAVTPVARIEPDPESDMCLVCDVPVPTRDGTILRANVFTPTGGEAVPAIVSIGPYGKDIPFEVFNKHAYDLIDERGPNVHWETATPDFWVARGYAIVRVDQRGTGKSDGVLHLHSPKQSEDFYDVIEWVAVQSWCTGKVGLLGVSYYAITQWQVAALSPPSLTAIVPWEGASDLYREWGYHGGMRNNRWMTAWWNRQVLPNQSADPHSRTLAAGNVDHVREIADHPFDDDYYAARTPDLTRVTVPLLSAGNWGGAGLHLRGNIEGFLQAGSEHKWLSMHTGNHTTPFYTENAKKLQLRFLDYWLKGIQNGLLEVPPVRLDIRRGDATVERYERAWPIPRTQWVRFYLDAASGALDTELPSVPGSVSYQSPGGEIRLVSSPFADDLELTGPLSCTVWMASTVPDMDVHVALLELDEHGREIVFDGSRYEPNSITYGWLRASHRELDSRRTLPCRPYHSHQRAEPLVKDEVVELAIEIWPTSVVIQAGHRLAIVIGAQDYHTSSFAHTDKSAADSTDRFSGTNSLFSGPETPSFLLVPVIPEQPA